VQGEFSNYPFSPKNNKSINLQSITEIGELTEQNTDLIE
jgi:hypothetical protein